ncbi:aminoacyl-tRNA deacylase [Aliikangiella sp. IMCC44653]
MYSISPIEYLDSLLIDYTLIPHATTFTAQETAETAQISGKELSKVVVIEREQQSKTKFAHAQISVFTDSLALLVIPAQTSVVKSELRQILGLPNLTLAPESHFINRFPLCEAGAMPPFGRLYNIEIFIADKLIENNHIIFNGGTHNLLIKMRTKDYLSINNANVISAGYRNLQLERDSNFATFISR